MDQKTLENNYLVICDRYRDSSYVYQAVQGKNQGISEEWMREINKYSLTPDLTIIMDIDPDCSLKRKFSQLKGAEESAEKFEELTFQKNIREHFRKIVKNSPVNDHHAIIDADQSQVEVFNQIQEVLKRTLLDKGLFLGKLE